MSIPITINKLLNDKIVEWHGLNLKKDVPRSPNSVITKIKKHK